MNSYFICCRVEACLDRLIKGNCDLSIDGGQTTRFCNRLFARFHRTDVSFTHIPTLPAKIHPTLTATPTTFALAASLAYYSRFTNDLS